VSLVVSLFGLPTPSVAQTPPDAADPKAAAATTPSAEETSAAEQHYQAGAKFYQAANYPAARLEFEAAYQLTHLPDLLYNLAQVAQKQGRSADELRYWEEYLATNPKDVDEVRSRLEQLRKEHPELTQKPSSATPSSPPPSAAHPLPVPALGLAIGGAAALIIGVGCGSAALAAANSVANPANTGMPFTPALYNTQERGKQLNVAAITFDVVGGAALAAGGAWLGYWIYQREKQKKAAAAPKVALLPSGLGLSLVRSF
jgi:tetratricopeptide (TPR) repeat protein